MTKRLAMNTSTNHNTTIRCEPEMDVKWLYGCLTVSVTGVGFGLLFAQRFLSSLLKACSDIRLLPWTV